MLSLETVRGIREMTRRQKYILLGSSLMVLLLIVGALVQMYLFRPRITQAEVKQQIQTSLPLGATIEQTVTFLRAYGWIDPHNVGIYFNRGKSSSDGFEQKDVEGSTLLAAIPDAYPGFPVSGGIFMKFGFDASGHLTRYELRDIYTGP